MPYMYCNKQGCNETVKLPAQYCPKHMVKGVGDLTVTVDTGKVAKQLLADKGLLDIIEPTTKTKKTTK